MQRSAHTAAPPHWAVRVGAVGPVSGGAIAWRYRGSLRLTAIVKASFALAADAPMKARRAADLYTQDEHLGGDLRQSLTTSSDVAPYLLKTDVLLTGHAQAYAEPRLLRLAISGRQVMLDKTVQLAARSPLSPDGAVALVYEEAFGGAGNDENPVGSSSPRLRDPVAPTRPACFAPLSQGWPARSGLLAGFDRRKLEGSHLDLPPSFDWSFFQAAPLDQRVDYLRGDEWILLGGMHPTQPALRTKLPSVRGTAELRGLPSSLSGHIEMNLDTLHIDVDEQSCSVVFRGSIVLPAGTPLGALDLSVSVEDSAAQSLRPRRMSPARAAGLDSTRPTSDAPPESPLPGWLSRQRSTYDPPSAPTPAQAIPPRAMFPAVMPPPASPSQAMTFLAMPSPVRPAGTLIEDQNVARGSQPEWPFNGGPFAVAAPSPGATGAPEIAGAPWASVAAVPAPRVPNGLKATFPLDMPADARAVIQALRDSGELVRPPLPAPPAVRVVPLPTSTPIDAEPDDFDQPTKVRPSAPPLPAPPSPEPSMPPAPAQLVSELKIIAPTSSEPHTRDEVEEAYTTASPERERVVAPIAPPPARRASEASEAVRGNVYGKFGARRK